MLQQLRRFPLVAVLVLAAATAACDDDPSDPDDGDDGDGTSTVTFTFTPPVGAPAVTSVVVPGSFNEPTVWDPSNAAYAMTQNGNTWSLTVELEPGTYEYKYYINGAWVENMCDDATWGAAGTGDVSPQQEGCDAADNNNALITVVDDGD